MNENALSAPAQQPADDSFQRPQRGDELELTIDSLAFGGEGVARLGDTPFGAPPVSGGTQAGGYVVFVAGAIPGDRVRAVVHKRKRSYAHARTLDVLEPSPERIAPVAHHPGVPWQVLPYARQLQIKQQQVDEALRRIGHLDGFELREIVPAVEQWRYRNKLEYSFGEGEGEGEGEGGGGGEGEGEGGGGGGGGGEGEGEGEHDGDRGRGELICGFHAPAGGNRVTPMHDCLLASERGNLAREVALRWCRAERLTAWDRGRPAAVEPTGPRERGHRGGRERRGRRGRSREQRIGPAADGRARLRNLVVREGRRSGQLQVRIVTTAGELEAGELAATLSERLGESLSGVLWTRLDSLAETTGGGETELVWGEAKLPERLGELALEISAEAFFQTNTEMAERLYAIVAEYAALEGWERVYDLYSGIGTIALTLAPRAGELWGIELIEDAVADAIAAARRNEITKASFFAGDTRLALPDLLARAGRPDVLVVDPPRAGLSKKVVHRIVDAAPKRIVYISCNPTTLAPNAAELVGSGWKLREVTPVDMFPQTHHIECVALLERG
ncbi:MAG TPA: 23S rRNA (uracil(1939)-C(5))-methyltransferase RlmD [Solirubrobacteraceae bacterium]|nr:23S rRNA (uracil(1939)-C(5))-methyltransferase RlmD [Solirubrobacteraceae bacterium]